MHAVFPCGSYSRLTVNESFYHVSTMGYENSMTERSNYYIILHFVHYVYYYRYISICISQSYSYSSDERIILMMSIRISTTSFTIMVTKYKVPAMTKDMEAMKGIEMLYFTTL